MSITTPSGEQVAVYLSRDASYSQRRTAWHLTRAVRALRAVAPSFSFEVARAASAVVHQWKEVVTCTYDQDSNSVEVEWRAEVLQQLGVDIDTAKKEFAAMVARAPPAQGG